MLILTDHTWLNLAPFSISLAFTLFTAAAGAAPQAPSPTGPLLRPCTSPTTHLLLRRPQQQPPPSPCPWRLTRTPPTASPLPCSPRRTHITPICSLLQRPCLHHHHLRLAPCQYPDILLLGVPTQVNITAADTPTSPPTGVAENCILG